MSKDANSTRRSFLKRGALLAAPLAAAAPTAVLGDNGLKARLARLEDEAAIRNLHQNWLRQINTETGNAASSLLAKIEGSAFGQAVRSILADHAAEPDVIEVVTDGKTANGQFPCAVEIETIIPQDCTLAQMAHAQGGGFVRRAERRILTVNYVKSDGAWRIAKAEFEPV